MLHGVSCVLGPQLLLSVFAVSQYGVVPPTFPNPLPNRYLAKPS